MLLSQAISTVAARGAVEKWLLQVQDVMLISIRDVIEKARDVSVTLSTTGYVYPHESIIRAMPTLVGSRVGRYC